MILLLGGTSETAPIAEALAGRGADVLVSCCTDQAIDIGDHPRITGRHGAMDAPQMRDLLTAKDINAVVDATHPYAVLVTETAAALCSDMCIPYYRFDRPVTILGSRRVHALRDHQQAAVTACNMGKNILLTTGSRNLEPYVAEANSRGCNLFVRVLSCGESLEQCRTHGIPDENVIAARGPFSVEDNESVIRGQGIDTLVTKDSGSVGGVPQKLEAAERCGCNVVLVLRPPAENSGPIHDSIESLLRSLGRDIL